MTTIPGHTCPGIDAAIRATRKAHQASANLAAEIVDGRDEPLLNALDRWNESAATLIVTLERVRRENAAMRAAMTP